jgi:hypothetical protein
VWWLCWYCPLNIDARLGQQIGVVTNCDKLNCYSWLSFLKDSLFLKFVAFSKADLRTLQTVNYKVLPLSVATYSLQPLYQRCPTLSRNKSQLLLWTGLQVACVKITMNGTPNHQSVVYFFMVNIHTHLQIWLQVGYPCYTPLSASIRAPSLLSSFVFSNCVFLYTLPLSYCTFIYYFLFYFCTLTSSFPPTFLKFSWNKVIWL